MGHPSDYAVVRVNDDRGRYVIDDGRLRPAVVTIPVSQAAATFGPAKPVAGAWFGKRTR